MRVVFGNFWNYSPIPLGRWGRDKSSKLHETPRILFFPLFERGRDRRQMTTVANSTASAYLDIPNSSTSSPHRRYSLIRRLQPELAAPLAPLDHVGSSCRNDLSCLQFWHCDHKRSNHHFTRCVYSATFPSFCSHARRVWMS